MILLERRPWVAGALFGLLCYKPQFGLLLPLALLAERQWRAIVGAALVVAAFAGLSAALFGMQTWREFLAIVPVSTHEMLEQGDIGFGKIQSVFGAARLWGASVRASYVMQAAYSLPAACAVLWISLKPVGFPVKAAALAAGTLLITPYFLDYDSVLLALPIAWLSWDAMHSGFLPWRNRFVSRMAISTVRASAELARASAFDAIGSRDVVACHCPARCGGESNVHLAI